MFSTLHHQLFYFVIIMKMYTWEISHKQFYIYIYIGSFNNFLFIFPSYFYLVIQPINISAVWEALKNNAIFTDPLIKLLSNTHVHLFIWEKMKRKKNFLEKITAIGSLYTTLKLSCFNSSCLNRFFLKFVRAIAHSWFLNPWKAISNLCASIIGDQCDLYLHNKCAT